MSWDVNFFIVVFLLAIDKAPPVHTGLAPRKLATDIQMTPMVAAVPNALLAVLVGLIAGIVMPFIAILLFITVLGIPLGLLLLVAWALIVMLSGAFAAYYLGRVVWRSQTNAIFTMLFGALIVVVLLLIPIINVIVWMLAGWYGSGVILIALKNHTVVPHYDMKKQQPRSRKT